MTMLNTLENLVELQNDTVKKALKRRDDAKAKIDESKKRIFEFAKAVHDVKEGDMDTLFTVLDFRIDDYANAVKWLSIEERILERYTERLIQEKKNG